MHNNDDIQRVLPGNRLSRAVIHNGTIYFAGIVTDDLTLDFDGQLRNILQKIESTLLELGSGKDKLLSATIFLTDLANYDHMNLVWDAWIIPGKAPARATVEARLAKKEFAIEIMVIAAV